MTWFRVDDGFYSHPKVMSIPRSIRAEAIGTWTLCGTWSADKEKDGFVPSFMVDELGGSVVGADALVEVGLWRTRAGKGYQFVNWKDFQPTRAQNEERREFERVRKAKQRAARNASNDAGVSEDVPVGHSPVPNTPSPSRPRPENSKTSISSSHSTSGSDDGDNPVDNYVGALEHVSERFGIDRLTAGIVVDTILGRRGSPPQSTIRYVKGAITRQAHEWERWVADPQPSNLPS